MAYKPMVAAPCAHGPTWAPQGRKALGSASAAISLKTEIEPDDVLSQTGIKAPPDKGKRSKPGKPGLYYLEDSAELRNGGHGWREYGMVALNFFSACPW